MTPANDIRKRAIELSEQLSTDRLPVVVQLLELLSEPSERAASHYSEEAGLIDSEPERVSAVLRRTVASRARGLGEYCRFPEEFSPGSCTVEHIQPRQAGGETSNFGWVTSTGIVHADRKFESCPQLFISDLTP